MCGGHGWRVEGTPIPSGCGPGQGMPRAADAPHTPSAVVWKARCQLRFPCAWGPSEGVTVTTQGLHAMHSGIPSSPGVIQPRPVISVPLHLSPRAQPLSPTRVFLSECSPNDSHCTLARTPKPPQCIPPGAGLPIVLLSSR